MKNKNYIFTILLFLNITTLIHGMHKLPKIQQMHIINPFFSNLQTIKTIKNVIDEIEKKNLGYPDYSGRAGLIWTDAWVSTAKQPEIFQECTETIKASRACLEGNLEKRNPQSIFDYPILKSIVSHEILPKTFDIIKHWTSLPPIIFAQIFFQRCHTSEPMDWHQDPGEDYDHMADFSLVLMLSEQDDPEYGWQGGKFKIRMGLPEDSYDKANVHTIIPQYNQGIIFNNQINSHATTTITSALTKSKRDIAVIALHLNNQPKIKYKLLK